MAESKVVRGRSPYSRQAVATGDIGAETLAGATDRLNETFVELERRLKPFGVNALVLLPMSNPFDGETHRVEFRKYGGTWQLVYVVATPDGFDEQTEEIPLVTAPRFVRVAAAEKIDELVRAVRTKAAEELQSVRSAIAAVEAAMAELPGPAGVVDDGGDFPF